MKDLRKED